jgi:hypothetical protein
VTAIVYARYRCPRCHAERLERDESICVELGDTFAGSGGSGGDYNPGGLRDGQSKFKGLALVTERATAASVGVAAPTASHGGRTWGWLQ